jgi:hypothetical protein
MILFQLDNYVLKQEIDDFDYSIQEEIDKFSVKSSYLEGDRRLSGSKSSKVILNCSGVVKSQHFLHYIRKLSEQDQGRGDIKCYFIEKYTNKSPDHLLYSKYGDKNTEPYQIRIYFAYCHIDITAINALKNENADYEYETKFDLSLWHSKVYDITNTWDGFIVDRYKNNPQYTWDDVAYYDTSGTYYYDEFIDRLQYENKGIHRQKNNLLDFYNSVTCCKKDRYLYIYFFDKIIKPFISSNFYKDSGRINRTIANEEFNFKKKNFLQTYLTSVVVSPNDFNVQNEVVNPLYLDKIQNPNHPYKISNIDNISNTFSTNGIIQIFRSQTNGKAPLEPITNTKARNLFDDLSGTPLTSNKFVVKVTNSFETLSEIEIGCNDKFLIDNLKMMIIHPHNQKVYGIMNDITLNWNINSFNYNNLTNNLVDLEQYLINGKLTIWSNIYDNQDWLRFSPAYRIDNSKLNNRENNQLHFSYKPINSVRIPNYQEAIVCQIETYTENKLI